MGFVTITMTIKLQDQTRLLDYHNHFDTIKRKSFSATQLNQDEVIEAIILKIINKIEPFVYTCFFDNLVFRHLNMI